MRSQALKGNSAYPNLQSQSSHPHPGLEGRPEYTSKYVSKFKEKTLVAELFPSQHLSVICILTLLALQPVLVLIPRGGTTVAYVVIETAQRHHLAPSTDNGWH